VAAVVSLTSQIQTQALPRERGRGNLKALPRERGRGNLKEWVQLLKRRTGQHNSSNVEKSYSGKDIEKATGDIYWGVPDPSF